MSNKKGNSPLYFFAAAGFTLLALYAVLWVFSSADLAFLACDGKFSLFATSLSCRQPYLALILFGASVLIALICTMRGIKSRQK